MNGSTPQVPSDGPIPAELLADLQAGLLDDATAARVRRRVRTDPHAGPEAKTTLAALDRVRRDLAELGRDTQSAPPVPAEVSARLSEVLRAEPAPPAPSTSRWRPLAAVAGACAAVVAAVVGVVVLVRPPGQVPSTLTSLGKIAVSPPPREIGLSESQIQGLLSERPDLGPLTDPQHRTACLAALGYPSDVRILGARPLDVAGHHGVLVLVPPNTPATPDSIVGLVVATECDAGHAAPLAETVIKRPASHP
ncbi:MULTISPECIES: hypothetical protein [unclassified Mycolicibacterium]|uniref:hypothetical protein n=1 Tax=unclassified Mycolicibacterium TaxID=2636767 RepID=UPI0012DC5714|nr:MULTISPECIES: hypothetical protein [unclassified Mycolicibacterium]MUL82929.1 hypothetical protein [Mycolicibacterium sp. CBMA 329]MUL89264.1 hypothetical protein [Mycolicibacterium sp. CBMA 331]MUL97831.1 hypothetical protein [Mycolicibacterium sp. CBMA 334]MUM29714.1 hypothetical protein [Mycolicibacterium sp. CBMA 295]MUM38780.1 hypothetical protein [Mycolicibacterium sp. CBMA 247]